MSLAESLGTPAAYRPSRPCTLRGWLDTLDPAEAAAVQAALYRTKDDPLYWGTPALHRRLCAAGWSGSEAVVYKHRDPNHCRSCR